MKRMAFCTIVLVLVLGIAACSRKEKHINVNDITASTMLARADGELQVATIEEFDKAYYKLDELKDFIEKEVSSYNKSAGADLIKVNKVELRDKKAVMLLTYKGIKDYSAFNKVKAAYFNGGANHASLDLPKTLVNVENKSHASTTEVLRNDKLKILVLNEPYHIRVGGKVAYYSDNASLIDDNEVESTSGGITVVVYKP